MTLLIDNYDSFSYNLYQMLGAICPAVQVVRNGITIEEIENLRPARLVISPGPGRPKDSGNCPAIVRAFCKRLPILGVCLGHQVIYEVFGGTVSYAKELMHGKASPLEITADTPLFARVPSGSAAARYHSLACVRETLPPELTIIAETRGLPEPEIMAVAHREFPVYGVQFHPESILTQNGARVLENFCGISTGYGL